MLPFQLHPDRETVSHLRTAKPFLVEEQTSIRDVIARMQREKRASALIVRNDTIRGIITERDVVRIMAQRIDLDQPIDSVMTRNPTTIAADASVAQAIELMSRGGFRRLPILDANGSPIGLLKVSHVLHDLVQHFPRIIYNLPPKPHVTLQEREGA